MPAWWKWLNLIGFRLGSKEEAGAVSATVGILVFFSSKTSVYSIYNAFDVNAQRHDYLTAGGSEQTLEHLCYPISRDVRHARFWGSWGSNGPLNTLVRRVATFRLYGEKVIEWKKNINVWKKIVVWTNKIVNGCRCSGRATLPKTRVARHVARECWLAPRVLPTPPKTWHAAAQGDGSFLSSKEICINPLAPTRAVDVALQNFVSSFYKYCFVPTSIFPLVFWLVLNFLKSILGVSIIATEGRKCFFLLLLNCRDPYIELGVPC